MSCKGKEREHLDGLKVARVCREHEHIPSIAAQSVDVSLAIMEVLGDPDVATARCSHQGILSGTVDALDVGLGPQQNLDHLHVPAERRRHQSIRPASNSRLPWLGWVLLGPPLAPWGPNGGMAWLLRGCCGAPFPRRPETQPKTLT